MGSDVDLAKQIDKYSNESETRDAQQEFDTRFVNDRLGEAGLNALHKGVLEYRTHYQSLIHAHYPSESEHEKNINNRRFFREKFIDYIAKINASEKGKFSGDEELRKTHPEKATILMNDFLGPEGTKLYKLALEEEMNSSEYMNAVFRASTTHFEGEKWAERPIIIVAGPSGCGKSFAAKAAVEKANELLPKKDGNDEGNDVVAVDGGIAREVSQMRKLVIQAANNKGYPGISDLHSQSKILEGVKDRMQATVLEPSTKVGVVIPETFSDFSNPLGDKKKFLQSIIALPNAKPIFCRVDGEDRSLFQRVVAFMGSRRAWKTAGFGEELPLDLNNTNIPESKAYGAGGFRFGQLGSYLAELWFRRNAKVDLRMKIINDLVLKKPEPLGSQNWVDAKQGDPGTKMISKRVFEKWENYRESLPEQDKKDPPWSLEKFVAKYPTSTLIQTSGEMDLAVAKEAIRKRILVVRGDLRYEKANKGVDDLQVKKLMQKLERLEWIHKNIDLITLKDKKVVVELKDKIIENINEMETNDHFGFFSQTKRALNRAVSALDKIAGEISDDLEFKDRYVAEREVNAPVETPSTDEIENFHSNTSSLN